MLDQAADEIDRLEREKREQAERLNLVIDRLKDELRSVSCRLTAATIERDTLLRTFQRLGEEVAIP